MKNVIFYNTFEPVVPLYDELIPFLKQNDVEANAVISKGIYREKNESLNNYFTYSWLPRFLRNNKRACALFYFLITPFVLLMKKSQLNIFLTQPPLFYIIGAFLSRFKRTPYIIHLMDMYPDLLINAGHIKENSLLYKLLDWLGICAYSKAAKIIVIGNCMKRRLIEKGISMDKISIIQNWSLSSLQPVPKTNNEFISRNNLGDKFIVMYSGNMGHSHILDTILSVAKKLESEKDIVFVFIGRGSKRGLVEQVLTQGVKNIQLFDYQPQELLAHSLSAADIHFLSLVVGFEDKVVPSKFYGILACGRPAFFEGKSSSEIAVAIKSHQCGAVIEPGETELLATGIMNLYMDSDLRESMAVSSREAYMENYHQSIAMKKYYDKVNEAMNVSAIK